MKRSIFAPRRFHKSRVFIDHARRYIARRASWRWASCLFLINVFLPKRLKYKRDWSRYTCTDYDAAFFNPIVIMAIIISGFSAFNIFRREFDVPLAQIVAYPVFSYQDIFYPIIDIMLFMLPKDRPDFFADMFSVWMLISGVVTRTYGLWSREVIPASRLISGIVAQPYRERLRSSLYFKVAVKLYYSRFAKLIFPFFFWPFLLYVLMKIPVVRYDYGDGEEYRIDYRYVIRRQGGLLLFVFLALVIVNSALLTWPRV